MDDSVEVQEGTPSKEEPGGVFPLGFDTGTLRNGRTGVKGLVDLVEHELRLGEDHLVGMPPVSELVIPLLGAEQDA